jgi:hypothetical protein
LSDGINSLLYCTDGGSTVQAVGAAEAAEAKSAAVRFNFKLAIQTQFSHEKRPQLPLASAYHGA